MLPVSGAEQFIASLARCPVLPMISAITAYYVCVRNELKTTVKSVGKTYLDIGQRDTDVRVVRLAEEKVPQSTGFSLGLKFFNDGWCGGPS